MTTDRSNLLTAGNLRMRKCYSITNAGAEPGLRGCTQDLRAGKCSKPSSRPRGARRVKQCPLPCGVRAAEGLQGSRARGPYRHSSGTAARLAGGRARTGATENLGSRRRLGGGTSVSEGSDAVGSVKGVHALGREPFGRPFRKRFCVCCTRADHRSPHPRSWQLLRCTWAASALMAPRSKSIVSSPLFQVL
jgi:hypothetical protein